MANEIGDKMCSKEYSITWNNHHSNVMGVFGKYFDEETLVDCTVAAEGEYLKAHRLMLSACSPYFERLFSQKKEKNKIVVLEDIKFENLKSLIAFVYRGQVTIPEDRLQDFVSAADYLQIKGLQSNLLSKSSRRETNEISVVCGKEGSASHILPKQIQKYSPTAGESNDSETKTALFSVRTECSVEPKQEVDVEDMPIWENEEGDTNVEGGPTTSTTGERNQNEWTPADTASTSSFMHNIPNSQSIVQPMHKVWVNEMQSCESEEEIVDTDNGGIHNQETSNQDVDVSSASDDCLPAAWPSVAIRTFPSTCTAGKSNSKDVHAQVVKTEQPEMSEQHVMDETQSIDYNDSMTDQVLVSAQDGAIEVDEAEVDEEGHVFKEQGMMVGLVEKVLKADIAVEQNEGVEDAAPLSGHISKESEKKFHKCLECSNVFHTVSDLQVHMKELHRTECLNRCEVCMAPFASISDLQRHMRRHSGESAFQCDVCQKSFRISSSLTRHMRTHTGERPFQCTVCKVSFRHKCHLNTHMWKHTGERPFQCDVCQMCFTQSSSLTRHMRTHTGERPFQCSVCEMAFSERRNLTTHMRKHTGERPFQCDVCKMAFKYQDNLTRHAQKHRTEHPVSISGM